jgi:hypothetical protein
MKLIFVSGVEAIVSGFEAFDASELAAQKNLPLSIFI